MVMFFFFSTHNSDLYRFFYTLEKAEGGAKRGFARSARPCQRASTINDIGMDKYNVTPGWYGWINPP